MSKQDGTGAGSPPLKSAGLTLAGRAGDNGALAAAASERLFADEQDAFVHAGGVGSGIHAAVRRHRVDASNGFDATEIAANHDHPLLIEGAPVADW